MTKLILLACTSLMVLSCSKPVAVNPYQPKLAGVWVATQHADDDNSNKKIDASELKPFTPGETLSLTFKADGTGSRYSGTSGNDVTYNFSWSVVGNYIDMRYPNDEVKMYIEKLDDAIHTVTLRSEDNVLGWTVYTKQ